MKIGEDLLKKIKKTKELKERAHKIHGEVREELQKQLDIDLSGICDASFTGCSCLYRLKLIGLDRDNVELKIREDGTVVVEDLV